MAKKCELTGRKAQLGNHVSHSNKKTRKRFEVNLQKKKFFVPELNKWVELKVSAKAIRTINKKGIYPYIKQVEQKRGVKIV
ncbi:MAG: 50S ribosomal protein L28 [Bacteroidetes bacterium SW_10_40_5]|nr:MAG: 50S ribosomal protein L28 [Bacteroidetes bacterium SW_10_40_5]